MPKKLSHEEYIESVKDILEEMEFEVVGTYIDSRTHIDVLHRKCGKVHQKIPYGIKRKKGCPYCADYSVKREEKKRERLDDETFRKKVFDLVGEEYTVVGHYKNNRTSVEMIHNKCGNIIHPIPYEFLKKGTRCKHCYINDRKVTHDQFVERVRRLTNNTYEVVGKLTSITANVRMFHKECGQYFNPLPKAFLQGTRCPYCSGRRSNAETFLDKLKETFGNEYSLVGDYIDASTKVKLLHNKCGETFYVEPIHLFNSSRGCSKCKWKENGVLRRKTHEQFLKEMKDLFGSEYKVTGRYVKAFHPVSVVHTVCGSEFDIIPNRFLTLNSGCQTCNQSSPEATIQTLLEDNNIKFKYNYKFDDCVGHRGIGLPFDFVIFDDNGNIKVIIEYDGQHHYKNVFGKEILERTRRNDEIKNNYCKENSINLIRIPYWERSNLADIIKSII